MALFASHFKKIGIVILPIFFFFILTVLYPLPDPYQQGVATVVLDNQGNLLRRFPNKAGIYREQIRLDQVSPFYIKALLNYEDKWFYYHPGINPFSILRAGFQWITNGHIISGGSTITMQVSRLINPHHRTIAGKFKQVFYALQLELTYTKDEILTLYLNLAPFGGNIEGIKAAANKYFNKDPDQLNKSEAALLVVLPQRPSLYRPDKAPELAKAMRNKVLNRSFQADLIAKNDWLKMRQDPLHTIQHSATLLAPLMSRNLQKTHPNQAIINTTIDGDLQRHVQKIFAHKTQNLPNKTSIAALVLRNTDAAVLAYRGSVNFENSNRFAYIDMVNAIRSPGSTLKPIIYGLAIEQGIIDSESLLSDIPTSFNGYKPKNLSGIFHGPVSASQALKLSLNVPAVQLMNKITPALFVNRLAKTPIDFKYKYANLSIALGGVGTNLWSLATLYRSFATGGEVRTPYIQLNTAAQDTTTSHSTLLSPEASWIIFQTLSSISAPDRIVPSSRRNIAWKTGTSYGYRDFWSIGVSPDYTVAVWVGRPDSTPVVGYLGATQASPIMFDIFDQLPRDKHTLKQPVRVKQTSICWPGGLHTNLTPADQCKTTKSAYTIDGITPPSMDSDGHFMTVNQQPTQLAIWMQKNKKYFTKQSNTPIQITNLKNGQHYFKESIDQLDLLSNKNNKDVTWYINDNLAPYKKLNLKSLNGITKVTACLAQQCDTVTLYVH